MKIRDRRNKRLNALYAKKTAREGEREREGGRVGWREYLAIYGVATMSRLLKIIGLFCKRAL